ncbi:polyhydroxyalkanoic acid system family protein [Sphingomonas sanxanigenens]|uniref:Polyhydroxyalkanoic acid synthase n=1 Tax=Sphingomonas sanxanigenens DSM 19645 = NX02 TaxID=1123269 RepID=W0A881_9SPHN|nr:polyhydroxyalkanoic acid system family protein [Sphingomonas sanxanigenens]AHE51870.1 hypothetical protein NX02_00510 [Sphingomonas sanxanigenens DSM 19645 = NX02]
MSNPLVIDIPHKLDRAEVRRRMAAKVGDLPKHIPGGMAEVRSSWPSEDRMNVVVSAMGQDVVCDLDVQDHLVRVSLVLPPLLGMMSGMIEAVVRERGRSVLEDKRKD